MQPRKMSRYRAWQAPLLSFFSRPFYADVAKNWTGTGLGYMAVLSTVAWGLTVIFSIAIPCNQFLNKGFVVPILKQIPHVEVSAGKLRIDRPSPYRIFDQHGVAWAVFKTDQKASARLVEEDDPPIVIGSEKLVFSSGNSKDTQTIDLTPCLAHIGTCQADGASLVNILRTTLTWLPLVVFILGLPIVFLSNTVQMLAYATIALALAHFWKKRPVPFTTALRLAAMAITPNVVLCALATGVSIVFLPLKALELIVAWAPVHSQLFHHIFAVGSILVASAYIVLGVHSLELVEETLPPDTTA